MDGHLAMPVALEPELADPCVPDRQLGHAASRDVDRKDAAVIHASDGIGEPLSFVEGQPNTSETVGAMKSPRERLHAANAVLRTAAAGSELASDAHLHAFEAYADLAMMPEARAELERARMTVAPGDVARRRELERHDLVLALLEGDYPRATQLLGAETGPNDQQPDWLARFLLRRELGFDDGDEADARARALSGADALNQLALILLLLDRGRYDQAAALARGDDGSLLGMAMAAEAASLLDDRSSAEAVYGRLLPFAGRQAIEHGRGSAGAVDRYLGLAAVALNRRDDAAAHLDAAVRINERMGARPWQAHAQRDLAALLGRRDGPGDASRAEELIAGARRTASALGMSVLLERLRQPVEHASRSVSPATRASAAQQPVGNVFRRDGEYWTVLYDGATFSVRDTKGMQYLGRLLAAPGIEFHVLDLASDGGTSGRAPGAPVADASAAELGTSGFGDAGEILDTKARDEYRTRLRDLDTEIAEAESWNDPERVARLQAERAFLIDELSAAVGLGGRSRPAASASERARLNVGKTIRSAIDRIETHNPALGRHLSLAVHTGTFCSYTPDPALNIVWTT
jgi:hypothetical protein